MKLNTKQGIVMQQVLQVYALTDSKNDTCKKHSKEFQTALKSFQPWALQMFDSSSKLQSGILLGNLMDYGSFKECIYIKAYTEAGEINGKHCVIRIQPTENIVKKILGFRNITGSWYENYRNLVLGASLLWSVCIPDSCDHNDVLHHFNKTVLLMTEGLDIKVSLDELDCYSLKDETPFSKREWIVLTFFLIILLINTACTTADIYLRKHEKEIPKAIGIFSAYSNSLYVFTDREDTENLSCLHGIRFISIFYVLVGHKFLMSIFFPLANTLDVIQWLSTYPSTIITGSTLSVDSFFVMSGLLVSYNFFQHVSQGKKFNLFLFYIYRYIRLTPPLIVVVLTLATFGDRFGSGPLWKKVSMGVNKPCQYFWWSTISYIQCYINTKHLCLTQSWYLNCDIQYYLCSPLILIPLWKNKSLGIISFLSLLLATLALNFYMVYTHEFKSWALLDNDMANSDYFTNYYLQPPARASPYLIGIIFGYFLFKTKDVNYKLGYIILTFGWILSLGNITFLLAINKVFQSEDYVYNKMHQSFYLTFFRPLWALSICWIIFVCREGYGGPINTILSSKVHQVLGKISYSIFLTHMEFQYLSGGSTKYPLYFTGLNLVNSDINK
ncbi:PREDICTED: nose resistant to fluoxetine protein 6-like [Nicrophorus vespilloides]|uniref:Nose resistant to fluoxetine protein 6-like n=1 Tax=Nicrophorus vespilloides TaxID=110193 RepID=A0ABM1NHZ6_NICVS|nr:PREDICTED: nose resistant to fluoxetine protein 6-like [Nicrophorus vespilloides]